MSRRKDGRPRSVVSVGLDPLPYVHACWDDGTCTRIGERVAVRKINDEFRPRDGYSQNEEDYL